MEIFRWKWFHLALAEQMKPFFEDKIGVCNQVWKLAKENSASRSLVFGLDKWKWRNYDDQYYPYLASKFVKNCLNSLENDLNKLSKFSEFNGSFSLRKSHKFAKNLKGADYNNFLHENSLIVSRKLNIQEIQKHAFTDLSPAAEQYSELIRSLAFRVFDLSDTVAVNILADALEDEYLMFEADHFRSGFHGVSCPLIQHILKGRI